MLLMQNCTPQEMKGGSKAPTPHFVALARAQQSAGGLDSQVTLNPNVVTSMAQTSKTSNDASSISLIMHIHNLLNKVKVAGEKL
jgi:hypothetical protein